MSGTVYRSALLENALIYRGAGKQLGVKRPEPEVVLEGQAALEPGDLVVRHVDGDTQSMIFLNALTDHPEWSGVSSSLSKDDLPWYEARIEPRPGNQGIDIFYPVYNQRTVISPSVLSRGDPLSITKQILTLSKLGSTPELEWINVGPHVKIQEACLPKDHALCQGIVEGYAANIRLGADSVSSEECIQSLADFLPDTMGDQKARVELLTSVLPGLFKDGQTPFMIDAVRALNAKIPLAHKLGFSAQKTAEPENLNVSQKTELNSQRQSRPKV